MTTFLENIGFDEEFFENLKVKLTIEGKSIFEYFPDYFYEQEFMVIFDFIRNNYEFGDKNTRQLIVYVYIFTLISLKMHLLEILEKKCSLSQNKWLEYSILAGDYFGGCYIEAFLASNRIGELKNWLEGLAIIHQKLIYNVKNGESMAVNHYIVEEVYVMTQKVFADLTGLEFNKLNYNEQFSYYINDIDSLINIIRELDS